MSTATATFVSTLGLVFGRAVRSVVALATAWERRRIVGQLGALDDHMLNDIGITRQDVLSVLAEPLYRDPSEQLAARASDARRAKRASAFAAHAYAAEFEAPSPTDRRAA